MYSINSAKDPYILNRTFSATPTITKLRVNPSAKQIEPCKQTFFIPKHIPTSNNISCLNCCYRLGKETWSSWLAVAQSFTLSQHGLANTMRIIVSRRRRVIDIASWNACFWYCSSVPGSTTSCLISTSFVFQLFGMLMPTSLWRTNLDKRIKETHKKSGEGTWNDFAFISPISSRKLSIKFPLYDFALFLFRKIKEESFKLCAFSL